MKIVKNPSRVIRKSIWWPDKILRGNGFIITKNMHFSKIASAGSRNADIQTAFFLNKGFIKGKRFDAVQQAQVYMVNYVERLNNYVEEVMRYPNPPSPSAKLGVCSKKPPKKRNAELEDLRESIFQGKLKQRHI